MGSDAVEVVPAPQRGWEETPPLSPPLRHWIAEMVEQQTWTDQYAVQVQDWILKLFGQPGQFGRKIKDILSGTWLGHALHPVLTDLPIGAWTGSMLFDLLWLNDEREGNARTAEDMLLFGLIAAVGTAITGVTDWSDQIDTDRRIGFIHGALNTGIALVNTASFGLRKLGLKRAGIGLSTVSYVALLFSAYLGGELSFAKGIGVNHDAFEGGPNDFVPVMNENDLVEGKLTRVDADGIPAVLLKQGSTIYAIGAICTHMGGPLNEGTVENDIVTCPWHGSQFRMTDGSVVTSPAVYAEPNFAVRIRDGKVELRRLDHA
ncbi:MAG TPA: Rieske 2Fe-2S domain-containing protein [Ktedonobacteraceae bacterium]|nr:Rieske 2Fe-2S domain-containing protein [Ktedonobacteraceae bacterium]